MAQEAVALVRELEQALAQPLELAAEALQVVRARDRDRVRERALTELADGAIELTQRAADTDGEHEDRDQVERQEQRRVHRRRWRALQRLRSSSAATSASTCALLCCATRSTSAAELR